MAYSGSSAGVMGGHLGTCLHSRPHRHAGASAGSAALRAPSAWQAFARSCTGCGTSSTGSGERHSGQRVLRVSEGFSILPAAASPIRVAKLSRWQAAQKAWLHGRGPQGSLHTAHSIAQSAADAENSARKKNALFFFVQVSSKSNEARART